MAEKKPLIVIKKITIEEAGHHGGAWKVAFADFMTALMTFFLVMWLLATATPAQKKNVSDYFSTPSIIEYNFSNYGVELTLEKLFLDLISEPLKFFQQFMNPVDRTPNIMAMGMKKVVIAHIANQLEDYAENVEVNSDTVEFEIPDHFLFRPGAAVPAGTFLEVMDKVKTITEGLEYADVQIDALVYHQSVSDGKAATAEAVAAERAELVLQKVQSSIEHEHVDVEARALTEKAKSPPRNGSLAEGSVRFRMKLKKDVAGHPGELSDGIFGKGDPDDTVYNNFVKKLTNKPK